MYNAVCSSRGVNIYINRLLKDINSQLKTIKDYIRLLIDSIVSVNSDNSSLYRLLIGL